MQMQQLPKQAPPYGVPRCTQQASSQSILLLHVFGGVSQKLRFALADTVWLTPNVSAAANASAISPLHSLDTTVRILGLLWP